MPQLVDQHSLKQFLTRQGAKAATTFLAATLATPATLDSASHSIYRPEVVQPASPSTSLQQSCFLLLSTTVPTSALCKPDVLTHCIFHIVITAMNLGDANLRVVNSKSNLPLHQEYLTHTDMHSPLSSQQACACSQHLQAVSHRLG